MNELVKLAEELDRAGLWSEADKVDELIKKMADPAQDAQVKSAMQIVTNLSSQLWQTATNIGKTLNLQKIQSTQQVLTSAIGSLRTIAAQASAESDLVKEAEVPVANDALQIREKAIWLKQQVAFTNKQVDAIIQGLDKDKIEQAAKKIEEANYWLAQFAQTGAARQAGLEEGIIKEAAKRFDIEGAKRELKKKSETIMERDTGFTWASRSMAAYELFLETKDLSWLLRAEDLLGEAREHAAKAGDDGKSLALVEKAVAKYKKRLPVKLQLAEPE